MLSFPLAWFSSVALYGDEFQDLRISQTISVKWKQILSNGIWTRSANSIFTEKSANYNCNI